MKVCSAVSPRRLDGMKLHFVQKSGEARFQPALFSSYAKCQKLVVSHSDTFTPSACESAPITPITLNRSSGVVASYKKHLINLNCNPTVTTDVILVIHNCSLVF